MQARVNGVFSRLNYRDIRNHTGADSLLRSQRGDKASQIAPGDSVVGFTPMREGNVGESSEDRASTPSGSKVEASQERRQQRSQPFL